MFTYFAFTVVPQFKSTEIKKQQKSKIHFEVVY